MSLKKKQEEMVSKKTMSESYVDRDLSWMYFNHRILHEATKEQVPLLERLSFLGIGIIDNLYAQHEITV